VQELVRYLLENMYLDFQGEISIEQVRQYLRGDNSKEAKALLQKLIEDKGVDDLLLALADVLKEHLRSGINEQVVRQELTTYSDS
jgi:predicted GTPase